MVRVDEARREELRALLTLGLLAILWEARPLFEDLAKQGGLIWSFAVVIDYVVIFFWGAYAAFMILGWSSDILPERLCNELKSIAVGFLELSFLTSILFLVAALLNQFGMYMLAAIVTTILIILIRTLPTWRELRSKRVDVRRMVAKIFKGIGGSLVTALLLFLYIFAFLGPERVSAPFVIIDALMALCIAFLQYRMKLFG